MNEESKHSPSTLSPKNDNEVIALIKKLEQHLVFLEKKIDLLVSQSQTQPRSFNRDRGGRDFSRPPRPFGQTHRPGGGGGGGFKRRESGHGGDRPHEGRRFDKPHERSFDKPHGSGENRGFFRKKKPFFKRDRD